MLHASFKFSKLSAEVTPDVLISNTGVLEDVTPLTDTVALKHANGDVAAAQAEVAIEAVVEV